MIPNKRMTNTNQDIRAMILEGGSLRGIATELGVTEWSVRREKQAMMDEGRIDRGADRKAMRAETALAKLQEGVLDALKILGKKLPKGKRRSGRLATEKPVAVLHVSDLHLNELISTPSNTFDFEVASKRLQLMAMKARAYCKPMGVEKIVVAFGGDLMNSDRRIDEITNAATNRSRAMVLSAWLLQQMLMDLRQYFFIDCFAITGNEGRAKQELSFADPGVTDSYDASIYYMLQHMMEQTPDKGLRFHELQGNEAIFQVHQETFLMLHGHQVNMADQRKVQAIMGKKSAMNGTRITHILAGHIHSALVSDYASRSSSLSGGNTYSEEALGFCSKASQNLHIVFNQTARAGTAGLDGIKLDLQNVDHVEGYPIVEILAQHHARGSDKAAQAAINQPRRLVVVI